MNSTSITVHKKIHVTLAANPKLQKIREKNPTIQKKPIPEITKKFGRKKVKKFKHKNRKKKLKKKKPGFKLRRYINSRGKRITKRAKKKLFTITQHFSPNGHFYQLNNLKFNRYNLTKYRV